MHPQLASTFSNSLDDLLHDFSMSEKNSKTFLASSLQKKKY